MKNGHKLNDIKHSYTIDQVYLFYEKCMKENLEKQKLDAITIANAAVYATPSNDKAEARRKRTMWNKFVDSLTWKRIEKKSQKMTIGSFLGPLGLGGVKIKNKKKE